ncbi:MAG: hypothetical protein JXX14_06350 [Deltaproteobacteria bacterium]|nr:hypothetical protein [Deltaproteobacteria bacterium]
MKILRTTTSKKELKCILADYWYVSHNDVALKADGRICKRFDDCDKHLDTGDGWQTFPGLFWREYKGQFQAVLLNIGKRSKIWPPQKEGNHGGR